MIYKLGYLGFLDEDDFTANVIEWGPGYYTKGGTIEKPDSFPAFFKYSDSLDPHFSGNWVPCDYEELIRAFEKEIRQMKKEMWQIRFFVTEATKRMD